MEFTSVVTPGSINHDDIVSLFQYATDSTMKSWLGEIHPSFTPEDPKGRCYEDKWAECLLQGGHLEITCSDPDKDDEYEYSKTVKFTLKDMEKGLKILAKKYPHVFADVVNDNCDYWTYWNWLQCCLYKDIIFG